MTVGACLQLSSPDARKHLFVGRENCTALITQFQLFAMASGDGFLGSVKRRQVYDRSMSVTEIYRQFRHSFLDT
jgi:hypothetical protein